MIILHGITLQSTLCMYVWTGITAGQEFVSASDYFYFSYCLFLQQQIHAQQLPHAAHGPSLPMGPHPGLPGMGPGGLLAFSGGLGAGAVPGAASAPLTAAAAAAAAAAQQQHPLLKAADLHNPREPNDMKGPSSLPEERLVSMLWKQQYIISNLSPYHKVYFI